MQDIGTFDLKRTTTLLGVLPIKSFAKGDSIKIEQEGDDFTSENGADGYTDRIKNNSTSLMITIQLAQTSPVNDLLSALLIADKLTLKGIAPFAFKDLNGTTTISAKSAWLNKHPTVTNGEEGKVREWVIKTGSVYAMFVGGNE